MATIYDAAKQGKLAKVKELVEQQNANVNECNPKLMYTALHYATNSGNVDMTKYLLEHGADVNVKDKKGWTPIHFAACQKDDTILQLVCAQQGANLDAQNYWDDTPLHSAAERGKLACVQFLLSKNVSTTKKNERKQTAAQVASTKEVQQAFGLVVADENTTPSDNLLE